MAPRFRGRCRSARPVRHRRVSGDRAASGTSRRPRSSATRSRPSSTRLTETERLLGGTPLEHLDRPRDRRDPARSRSSPITEAASRQPASPRYIERAPGADPHPHPPEERRPERRPRARLPARLKYEHLYRLEIDDGHDLGLEAESYRQLFNADPTARGARRMRRPLDVHLEAVRLTPDHQANRARTPATFVTRDIRVSAGAIRPTISRPRRRALAG